MEKRELKRFNAASDKVRKAPKDYVCMGNLQSLNEFYWRNWVHSCHGFGGNLALKGQMSPGEITAFLLINTFL